MNYQLICYLPQIFTFALILLIFPTALVVRLIYKTLKINNRKISGFNYFLGFMIAGMTGYGFWFYHFLQSVFR